MGLKVLPGWVEDPGWWPRGANMVLAMPDRGWLTGTRVIDVRTDQERAVMDRIERIRSAQWRLVTHVRTRDGQPSVHVAVGPTGVFAITAELHDGEVRVDGNRILLNSVRSSISERTLRGAEAIAGALDGLFDQPIPVTPVLVLDGCNITVRQDPDRIQVLRSRHVPRWFRRQRKGPLTAEQGAQVEMAAREHDRLLR